MAICAFPFTCRDCDKTIVLELDMDDVVRWRKAGELVQNVFPQLSTADRELMISGICGKCFDELFGDAA